MKLVGYISFHELGIDLSLQIVVAFRRFRLESSRQIIEEGQV